MQQKSMQEIQQTMFTQEKLFLEMAAIFEALASDCRMEIIYLLSRIPELPSGEISRLTNCTPSQTSQYLAKMHRAGIVNKNRSWREISYSLNTDNLIVKSIVKAIQPYFTL